MGRLPWRALLESEDAVDELDLLTELVDTCRQLYQQGLVRSSGGNVSLRVGDNVWITATGKSLGRVRHSDLVQVNMEGRVHGPGQPSKELPLHMAAYRVRSEARVVLHLHPPYSVCVSCLDPARRGVDPRVLPPMSPGYVARVGSDIPLVPFYISGSSELETAVAQALKTSRAAIMANHGVIVAGLDFEQAANIVEEIEANAMVYILCGEHGHPLSPDQVAEIIASLVRPGSRAVEQMNHEQTTR